MFKNYFISAFRNIIKGKGYTLLNIFGLATGMGVALLVGLWVYHEYSYDKFLPNYKQLYKVQRNFDSNGEILTFSSTSLKLAETLRSQVPEIEYVVESDYMNAHGLMVGDKRLLSHGGIVGNDFFKMFPYPFVKGNAQASLKDPYSIVLTESTALSLFGKEDPVNKLVRFDNHENLKVTGIIKDIPSNSSLSFQFIVPFSLKDQTDAEIREMRTGSFGNNNFQQFVQLRQGSSYERVLEKIKNIEKTETNNINAMKSEVILQPFANIHLYGNYENGVEVGGFVEYVKMFSIIGIMVLLIACINFVNLTTARSEKRAKEVGIRKAIGSLRRDLILQFLIESTLLAFLSFIVCLFLVQMVLPFFNTLTGSDIVIPFSNSLFWLIALGGILVVSLLAGSRPAFYLSSFKPEKTLKGALHLGRNASIPRKILVVLQFSCSVALIISTIIVYQQIQYARERPTGYRLNRLMITGINGDLEKNYTALKNDLLKQGLIDNITTSSSPATGIYWHADIENWPGKYAGETVEMGIMMVDEEYFKTMGMQVATGRDFIEGTDSNTVIFNEAAIKRLRLKQPLSQSVTWN
ncbi:MAG: ABC transporter permease, partial [Flavitalea sp.]